MLVSGIIGAKNNPKEDAVLNKRYLKIGTIGGLVILVLLLGACGGKKEHRTTLPAIEPTQHSPITQTETSLEEALAQLDAYQAPEGVDPALFEMLKTKLRDALVARGVGKFVSAPPGEGSRVIDLDLVDLEGIYTLAWHYRNEGDYDQDGIVGITDVTPIAIHFG